MGGAYNTYGRQEMCIEDWWENLTERDHLEYLATDKRIILKGMFNKWDEGYGLD
jgi:hypothetical protein